MKVLLNEGLVERLLVRLAQLVWRVRRGLRARVRHGEGEPCGDALSVAHTYAFAFAALALLSELVRYEWAAAPRPQGGRRLSETVEGEPRVPGTVKGGSGEGWSHCTNGAW